MRNLISLFIFADGAAAAIGAIIALTMRTETGRWPAVARVITVVYAGYAMARLGIAWNTMTNLRPALECVRGVAPDFYTWFRRFTFVQALSVWSSVILLLLYRMNGHWERMVRRIKQGARGIKRIISRQKAEHEERSRKDL